MSDEVSEALALIHKRIADSEKLLAGRKNEVEAMTRKLDKAATQLAATEQRYLDLKDATDAERIELKKQPVQTITNAQLEQFIYCLRGKSLPADTAAALATAFAGAFPYYPGGAARLRACGTGIPTRAAKDSLHSYLSAKFKSIGQCKAWLSKWARGEAVDFEYECGWRTLVSYCSDVLENTYNKERHYLDTLHGAELYEHLVGDSPRETQPKKETVKKLF